MAKVSHVVWWFSALPTNDPHLEDGHGYIGTQRKKSTKELQEEYQRELRQAEQQQRTAQAKTVPYLAMFSEKSQPTCRIPL